MPGPIPTVEAGQQSQPQPPKSGATCPLCRGGLIPLGGVSRCSRCLFIICEGCEGGVFDDPPDRD
jgi:hypothetical protein